MGYPTHSSIEHYKRSLQNLIEFVQRHHPEIDVLLLETTVPLFKDLASRRNLANVALNIYEGNVDSAVFRRHDRQGFVALVPNSLYEMGPVLASATLVGEVPDGVGEVHLMEQGRWYYKTPPRRGIHMMPLERLLAEIVGKL